MRHPTRSCVLGPLAFLLPDPNDRGAESEPRTTTLRFSRLRLVASYRVDLLAKGWLQGAAKNDGVVWAPGVGYANANGEMETTAMAQLAFQPDAAVHHLHQPGRNGEA